MCASVACSGTEAPRLDAAVVDAMPAADAASVTDAALDDAAFLDADRVDADAWIVDADADAIDASELFDASEAIDMSVRAPLWLNPLTTKIVLRETDLPRTHLAVTELRSSLLFAYGVADVPAHFAVVDEAAIDETFSGEVIALGETRFAPEIDLDALWRDGYELIRTGDRVVSIRGGRRGEDLYNTFPGGRRGLYLGVIALLDRIGVRFYMPSELWTSRPSSLPVSIGELDETKSPFMKTVNFSGMVTYTGRTDPQWARRNGVDERRTGGTHQHNMFAVFPPSRFADRYPEIYPMRDGVRYLPTLSSDQTWQPCFSEPNLVEAAIESALLYFEANPSHEYLAFSMNDGGAACERDPAVVSANPVAFGEVYWRFIEAVAERFGEEASLANKKVVALAYGPTRLPPSFALPENVLVYTNLHPAELEADGEMYFWGPFRGWSSVATHYGNHTWAHGLTYLIPRVFTSYLQEYVRAFRAFDADSRHFYAEAYPSWGLDGPKLYLLGRLLADPEVDVATLRAQFAADLMPNVAADIDAYFATLEALWTQLDNVDGPERKLAINANQFATTPASRALIATARAHLDAALLGASEGDELERVRFFDRAFHVSEVLFELARRRSAVPAESTRALADELRLFQASDVVPHPNMFFRASDVLTGINVLDTVP